MTSGSRFDHLPESRIDTSASNFVLGLLGLCYNYIVRYYNIIQCLTFKIWPSYTDSNKADQILRLIRLRSSQCSQIER